MSLASNPFLSRLTQFCAPATLRSALARPAGPLADLDALPINTAKRCIEEHLQSIYVPNSASIELALRILESGLAHALRAYPDIHTFAVTATKSHIDVTSEPEVWMITGLAGDGKTSLISALKRLLGDGEMFTATPHCPRRRIRGGLFLEVHANTSPSKITAAVARQLGLDLSPRTKDSYVEMIQLELYRQGCSFLIVDEAQSTVAGKTGGAIFVKMINTLREFGVPVIIVGNYSMCHGLMEQHSQNRQRFLNDPFLMPTLSSDDPEYHEYLQAYKKSLDGMLAINLPEDAGRIHWLTAGGRRAFVNLIGMSYRLAREASGLAKPVIDLQTLENAYAHEGYTTHRIEAEKLRNHWISGSPIAKDMRCPFQATGERLLYQKHMVQLLRSHTNAAHTLIGTMSPAERKKIAHGLSSAPKLLGSDTALIDQKASKESGQRPVAIPISEVGNNVMKDMLKPKPKAPKRAPPTLADLQKTWNQ